MGCGSSGQVSFCCRAGNRSLSSSRDLDSTELPLRRYVVHEVRLGSYTDSFWVVDDALKTWTYKERFDLIHMRDMFGAFTDSQWTGVYKQAYKNLMPGGWIEQVEPGITYVLFLSLSLPPTLLNIV